MSTRDDLPDTGDGFGHVSVSGQVLRVDTRGQHSCGWPRARVPCVAAAILLGKVRPLKRDRDRRGVRGVVLWHDDDGSPVGSYSRCVRYSRSPHGGEPVLVFVRGDGVIFVEINTPLLRFEDWVAISPDVGAILNAFDVSDLLPPSSFVSLCFWSEKIASVESRLSECLGQLLVDRALHNVRRRFAIRVIDATISANLEAIKSRLWRPDGRLVARMLASG